VVDARFTGTINDGGAGAGTVLTVSAMSSGTIAVGDILRGTGIAAGTTILSQTSGTTGGVGVYVVSVSQNVPSMLIAAGNEQGPLMVTNCVAPASAIQTSLVGTNRGYDFSLLTMRDNEIVGYGNSMFQNYGPAGVFVGVSPVTSGNQIAAVGSQRTGTVTLSGGIATVANTAIRNKAAAAFGEAIVCNVDLRRATASGISGALYIDSIVDQQQFTIKSTNFVEPTRTNVIRNNTNVGVVLGVLGAGGALPTNWAINALSGLVMEVISTGTEVGPGGGTQNYIDIKLSGTATATNNVILLLDTATNPAAAASDGQTWTNSFGTKLVAGSMTGISPFINVLAYTGGGVSVNSFFNPISITSTAFRQAKTSTLSGGTVAFVRAATQLNVANGNTVDATVRYYMPQLEQAANASAPIATTNPAALTGTTRTADTLNADNSTVVWDMSL
jgi:hypothetical protein